MLMYSNCNCGVVCCLQLLLASLGCTQSYRNATKHATVTHILAIFYPSEAILQRKTREHMVNPSSDIVKPSRIMSLIGQKVC